MLTSITATNALIARLISFTGWSTVVVGLSGSSTIAINVRNVHICGWHTSVPLRKLPTASSVDRIHLRVRDWRSSERPCFKSANGSAISCNQHDQTALSTHISLQSPAINTIKQHHQLTSHWRQSSMQWLRHLGHSKN